MRLIDADYVLEGLSHLNDNRVDRHFIYGINTAVEMIENTPTIDAAPVVHGEWVKGEDDGLNTCSACKEYSEYATRFCCNCGAKMDGGK